MLPYSADRWKSRNPVKLEILARPAGGGLSFALISCIICRLLQLSLTLQGGQRSLVPVLYSSNTCLRVMPVRSLSLHFG